ncbi:hypothetical protein [Bifidobacterium dentium]|uniref:hypothetical protein n=1 Tax=Bifidobacterium dentium TaxID=1689 RepID=UPI001F510C43|nr:hypothetical protein [Bifidobacterium dentium]
MTEEEKKVPAAGEKGSRKRTVVIAAAIAAIVVLGGAGGGYAYAANKAYEAYESQVESAKAIDSKLVKKVESAQQLAKATKDTDVLDKTVLDSLNASVKTGEAQKGSPKAEDVNKWALWDVSKAKTTVADDITAATKAISVIDSAMGKVESSKTAKQVKDAKDTLNKTISDAETLYKDSEGKVADDKTRESLKTAIDTAKKTSDDKKSDVKALNTQKDAVANAVKSVNDSKSAKEQADAEAKAKAEAEEAARQAAQQQSQAQTQNYSNTNYNRTNSGTSTYSAPTQQAQTQQSTPQQSQNQNNSSNNSGYTKLCATGDTSGAESIFTPCN